MVNAMNYLGAVVPVVTPCARSGRLDEEGLCAVCDDMVAAGASGIFVMGSTGRGPWFSPQDRARAVRIARDRGEELRQWLIFAHGSSYRGNTIVKLI